MKKGLLKILLTLLTLFTFGELHAQISVNVGYEATDDENDSDDAERDNKNPRHRMPPRMLTCYISFEEMTISGPAILSEVSEYELWDEDEQFCLISVGEETEFVESLSLTPAGTYVIRFRGPGFTLFGLLNL